MSKKYWSITIWEDRDMTCHLDANLKSELEQRLLP